MKKFIGFAAVLLLLICSAGCVASEDTEDFALQEKDSAYEESKNAEKAQDVKSVQAKKKADSRENEQEESNMKISIKSDDYEIIYELNESSAAKDLYAQLPMTLGVEPFSNNEMTFYPEKLNIDDTPFSDGKPGSLSYYEPWGDVVMFYAPCAPNENLYELGTAVSGEEHISSLSSTITVTAVKR